LKELCNQICKSAIKEAIEAELSKKSLMKDGKGEDLDLGEDPVPTLSRRHFEYGLANCRMSVGDADLNKYEEFKRKYDPNFSKGQNTVKLNWPESDVSNLMQQDNKDDDLDLYS
jgi:transitional endoplasmic reticulum ATPase